MQPYEKFKKFGPEAMSEEELLAIMIRTGTKEKDSLALAKQILEMIPEHNLLGLFHCKWQDLLRIDGIGEVKAIKIMCIAELSKRISKTQAQKRLKFNHPATVAEYYMESMRHLEQERVLLIILDKKLGFMNDLELSKGTISASLLSPREIFISALKENAVQIMLLHNHPSGDPTPSEEDILVTRKIYKLSKLLDLPLVDHIIIGDNKYISLKEYDLF